MHQALVIIALIGTAAPAWADATTPGGRVIDCYCTDTQGSRVELGQEICLFVNGRAYMALCDMSLNVPIWRDTGRACLTSRLDLERLEPSSDTVGVDPKI